MSTEPDRPRPPPLSTPETTGATQLPLGRSSRPPLAQETLAGGPGPTPLGAGMDASPPLLSSPQVTAKPPPPPSQLDKEAAAARASHSNMRAFLEKLGRRRKRIPCSWMCKRSIEQALLKLREDPRDSFVPRSALHEMLRTPPAKVPAAVLRDLVDVSSAYDAAGDGYIDTEELLEGALEVEPSMPTRLRAFFLAGALVVWILLAPLVLCFADDWEVRDAFYFAFTSLSTVGSHAQRGLFLSDDWVKVFAAFYTLLGWALLLLVLISAIGTLLTRYDDQIRQLLTSRSVEDILASEGFGPGGHGPSLETLLEAPALEGSPPVFGLPLEWALAPPSAVREVTRTAVVYALRRVAACLGVMLLLIGVGMLLFYLSTDAATWADALFWSVAVSTTVGHDGHSEHLPPVGWSIGFIVMVAPVIMALLLEATRAHLHVRSTRLQAEVTSHVLPPDVLIGLDADGRGVSKVEFLCGVLLAMNKVSALDLWQALLHFQELDCDGNGVLTCGELAALRRDRHAWGRAKAIYAAEQAHARSMWNCCAKGMGKDVTEVVFADELPKPWPVVVDGSKISSCSQGEKITLTKPMPVMTSPTDHAVPPLPSSVRFASSVSTLFDGVGERTRISPPRDMSSHHHSVMSMMKSGGTKMEFLQFYDENLKVRAQLHERSEELVHALHAKDHLEQGLRQALTERQALHGEVRLQQHRLAELQEKVATLAAEKATAEKARQEAEQRVQSSARTQAQAEQRAADAESQALVAEKRRADAEDRCERAEERARHAEQAAKDTLARAEQMEREMKLQSDAKLKDLELRCAELEAKRQGEIKQGLLELQAVSAGQQALHKELQRAHQPLPLAASALKASQLKTGMQPWELWEAASMRNRSAVSFPPTDLLTGRVRDQALFLDQALQDLRAQQDRQ